MPVFYFPQYPSKGSTRLGRPWYWPNEWQNYPRLFNRGYKRFQRIIGLHNRRRPTDPWPELPYLEWKDRAAYFAKQRYNSKHPNQQTQQDRFNKRFFNWVTFEYGAWPQEKNPKYKALSNKAFTQPWVQDIRELKRQYLLDRVGIAAARAYDKVHNKNKKK